MILPDEIERLALLGWCLYPSSPTSRAGLIRNGTRLATCDLDRLEYWARQFPGCNWRVVLGPSAIWGLDVDSPETHANDGVKNLADLVKICGPLPPRPTCRTGGGGLALFFRWDGEHIIGTSGVPCAGVDPRRGSQSQTIPPSIHHKTGRRYAWVTPPWEVTPPTAPEWLLRRVQPPPEPVAKPVEELTPDRATGLLYKLYGVVAYATEGRNNTLNRVAYRIGRLVALGLISESYAFDKLSEAGRQAGLEHQEIKDTIRSAFRAARRLAAIA